MSGESDHDLLIRLDEKMDTALRELKKGDKRFEQLEGRMYNAEQWIFRGKGIIGAIVFTLTILASIVSVKLF